MGIDYKETTAGWNLTDPQYKPSDDKWHYVKNAFVKDDNGWHPVWEYDWVASAWSPCSAWCGPGTQTRTVTCGRSDGVVRHDVFCKGIEKPPLQQECDAGPCSWPVFQQTSDDWVGGMKFVSGYPPLDGKSYTVTQGCYGGCCDYYVNGLVKPPTGTRLVIEIIACDRKLSSSQFFLGAKSLGPTPLTIISRGTGGCCSGGSKHNWRASANCGLTVILTSRPSRQQCVTVTVEISVI